MAETFRSSVFACREETTEGTIIQPLAASFVPIRDGFSMQATLETLQSNELKDDIANSKSFVGKESPSGSFPKYLRHSGTEGTAPEYAVMIKSGIGTQTDNSTEYSTTGSSSAGSSSARASLEMGSGQEDNYQEGQAVLIKDSVNGYAIRNVYEVDSAGDQLNLNFNLSGAPATGTALGKAIHFRPTGTDHVSYSAWHYQASASSAFLQAMSGCKTTSMNLTFPANGFAEINFSFEGTQAYFNPLTVTAGSNDAFDFNDGSGEENATITAKTYNNPHELAREIQNKLDDLTSDNITVSYSDTTGKFTVASDGGTFSLLWNTGTNTATTIGGLIGFAVAADDTGATSYTGDNALTYSPSVTPAYDSADSLVIKDAELMIGTFSDNRCRTASTVSFTVSTPKTDIQDICSESGIDSSIINSREVTMNTTIALAEHEAGLFDRMINNTTTQVMLNAGSKTGTDWDAGKCVNIYMGNASIVATPIAENEGYVVFEVEAKGFVSDSRKDFHINFI